MLDLSEEFGDNLLNYHISVLLIKRLKEEEPFIYLEEPDAVLLLRVLHVNNLDKTPPLCHLGLFLHLEDYIGAMNGSIVVVFAVLELKELVTGCGLHNLVARELHLELPLNVG